jgi:DNA-nicking Smr family endonuclease
MMLIVTLMQLAFPLFILYLLMGNCFGSSSATAGPPAKRHKADGQQKFVTDQVLALRNQADGYHQKVVASAKESQQAYQKGDKQRAKTLSEDKKRWQQRQDDANRKAAQLILKPQASSVSGEIDLHGLYLDEALEATQDFLKYWSKKTASREMVLIITGAGHHSENNKAVIRPKVEALLRKERLRYESAHGNGAFQVYLKPSQ